MKAFPIKSNQYCFQSYFYKILINFPFDSKDFPIRIYCYQQFRKSTESESTFFNQQKLIIYFTILSQLICFYAVSPIFTIVYSQFMGTYLSNFEFIMSQMVSAPPYLLLIQLLSSFLFIIALILFPMILIKLNLMIFSFAHCFILGFSHSKITTKAQS